MKKEQSTERVLYAEMQPAIKNVNLNVKYFRKLIETSLNEWSKVCDTPLSLQELEKLATNNYTQARAISDLLAKKLLAGKSLQVNGLNIDPAKLQNLITIPEAIEFVHSVEAFKRLAPGNSLQYGVEGCMWNFYSLSNGKVQVNDAEVELHLDSRYRDYAETPEELSRLQNVLPLIKALNDLTRLEPSFNRFWVDITNCVMLNAENVFEPHPAFIRTGSQTNAHSEYVPTKETVEVKPDFSNIHD